MSENKMPESLYIPYPHDIRPFETMDPDDIEYIRADRVQMLVEALEHIKACGQTATEVMAEVALDAFHSTAETP